MATMKEIYNHCKTNNKPMLMNNTILSLYPVIPDSTANFISDYLANFSKYDRVFTQKYMSKRAIFIDEKDSFPSIYNEWIENCNDFVLYYINNWALLYHSLCDPANYWNPTHNYDGTNTLTEHTEGQVEGLSGKDITNSDLDDVTVTNIYGERTDTNNVGTNNKLGGGTTVTAQSKVPTDSLVERMTDRESTTTTNEELETTSVKGSQSDTTQTSGRLDSVEINYGKKNDVDYTKTTTEVKGGNLGVTTVPTMIAELQKLDAFWETVYSTLARELTIWEV